MERVSCTPASNRSGSGFRLFQKPTAGAGPGSPLLDTGQNMIPEDWSRDGRFISFATLRREAGTSGLFAVGGNAKPFPVTQTSYDEMSSQFSPDGHWIAFESNESGRNEIYVQPFPNPATKRSCRPAAGCSRTGGPMAGSFSTLRPDGRLMSVPCASVRSPGH